MPCTRRYALAGLVLTVLSAPAAAQTHSKSASGLLSLTVPASVRLTLSVTSIAFPDANPDHVPSIPATAAVGITARARSAPGASVVLSVIAGDDLRSGTDTIPASALSWTAAGDGFRGGTMSQTSAQTVAIWTSSGLWTGTQSYLLANSWDYPAGSYSATLTYTLSAP